MPTFSEYDLDGDGKLLEKEFYEARSKRISERTQQGYQMRNIVNAPSFADIDTNDDGEINSEEFAAHQAQRRQQRAQ
jgi:Ca2+-binding EF-hand superfamily protein